MVGRFLETSFKPFWLLGAGLGIGLVVLLLLWCLLLLVRRRWAMLALETVREGVVLPAVVVAALLAGFAVVVSVTDAAFGFRFFEQKAASLSSVLRTFNVGTHKFVQTVPAGTKDHPLALNVRPGEFKSLKLDSPGRLFVKISRPDDDEIKQVFGERADAKAALARWGNFNFYLEPGKTYEQSRGKDEPWPLSLSTLLVTNETPDDVELAVELATDIAVPQANIIPITATSLAAYVIVLVLLRIIFPKVSAVAAAGAKEAMSQPLFLLSIGLGAAALLVFIVIPYNTFGEDVKILKESGATLIMVLAMIFALWMASVSVAEEIEGRTALTVLSKPIGRPQFVIGKYLGIVGAVAVMFILLGTFMLWCVSYKVCFESRETSMDLTWYACHNHAFSTVPSLVLHFLQVSVLASVGVALSTRLPMLPNLIVCSSIYVLGNLVPQLASSTVGKFEAVQFMGRLIATILPVLDHFEVYGAIVAEEPVPWIYLGTTLVYALIYITIAMLLALVMFEDRDLA